MSKDEKEITKSLVIEMAKAEVAVSDDGYFFKGYASVFNGIDAYGDTILPGAFKSALTKGMPKMFFNHDTWRLPIGKWNVCKEDEKGLYVEGQLTKGMREADDVAASLVAGTVDGLSIGFSVKADGLEYNEETDGYIISKINTLREISVVTFPADNAARIEKAESLDSVKDVEKFLRDAGLSKREAQTVISRLKSVVLSDIQRDAESQKKATQEVLDRLNQLTSKL